MDQEFLRLECLKLASIHAADPQQLARNAEGYFDFIQRDNNNRNVPKGWMGQLTPVMQTEGQTAPESGKILGFPLSAQPSDKHFPNAFALHETGEIKVVHVTDDGRQCDMAGLIIEPYQNVIKVGVGPVRTWLGENNMAILRFPSLEP